MTPRVKTALVLGFAAVLFGMRATLPLLEPEEARYAEIPRQMLVHHRMLVPIHDGQDYLDKPPLLYWMVMASYRVFGVHDWSARLPTIGAAWLTVLVVLGWGWRTASPDAGLVGALVLTLTGDFIYRAPMLTMNGPLALFVATSLAAGHVALLDGLCWRWWLVSAVACGLGVLMKGPAAIALVGPSLVCSLWLDRRLTRPPWYAWLAWGLVAAAVAGPWFVAVAVREPGFLEYFFWKHHVERVTAPFDHAGPIWDYVPQVVIGFFPWSMAALWLAFSRKRRLNEDADSVPTDALVRVALCAGLWGFLLFSLAGSKRPVYLVPVEPPLALAAGAFFWRGRAALPRPLWLGLGASTALAIGGGIALWMPLYSEQFSIAAVVKTAHDADLPADVPVLCYGHGWDSVGFYLGRDDVKTYLGDRRADIVSELARHPRSLVFVTTKRDGDDFEDRLPPGMHFEPLGTNRHVRAALVTMGR